MSVIINGTEIVLSGTVGEMYSRTASRRLTSSWRSRKSVMRVM